MLARATSCQPCPGQGFRFPRTVTVVELLDHVPTSQKRTKNTLIHIPKCCPFAWKWKCHESSFHCWSKYQCQFWSEKWRSYLSDNAPSEPSEILTKQLHISCGMICWHFCVSIQQQILTSIMEICLCHIPNSNMDFFHPEAFNVAINISSSFAGLPTQASGRCFRKKHRRHKKNTFPDFHFAWIKWKARRRFRKPALFGARNMIICIDWFPWEGVSDTAESKISSATQQQQVLIFACNKLTKPKWHVRLQLFLLCLLFSRGSVKHLMLLKSPGTVWRTLNARVTQNFSIVRTGWMSIPCSKWRFFARTWKGTSVWRWTWSGASVTTIRRQYLKQVFQL